MWVLRCLVTGWTRRSSEKGTETSGHWLDTVDRQRVCYEMRGHWFDTIPRQRRFGHWSLVRHSRSSMMGTKTFGYWLDTVDRQRGILRCLVSGWTQEIASEGFLRRLVTS